MADKGIYEGEVANYTGGEPLTLEVGTRDGQVYIRLSKGETETLHCRLEPGEAEALAAAITDAAKRMTEPS